MLAKHCDESKKILDALPKLPYDACVDARSTSARIIGRKGILVNSQFLKAAALATITLAIPLAASANSSSDSTAPVHINDVQFSLNAIPGDGALDMPQTTVSFTNLNPSAAKDVLFFARDEDGRVIGSYDDHGTFAQGVVIRHTFSALNPDLQRKLEIEEVTFADGSVWLAGQSNPMARRQAANVQTESGEFSKAPVH